MSTDPPFVPSPLDRGSLDRAHDTVRGLDYLAEAVKEVAAGIRDGDPQTILERLQVVLVLVSVYEPKAAVAAVEAGASWEQVGDCFGITAQAARERFSDLLRLAGAAG